MVEDYVPDRMEFDIATKATAVAKGMPFEVTVDGRFLYGAPASDLDLGGDVKVQPAAGRPGFAGYTFGAADGDEEKASVDQMLEDLPEHRRGRQGEIRRHHRQAAGDDASAGGAGDAAHGGGGRPRHRAQADAAGDAGSADDRSEAAVRRRVARRSGGCRLRCRGGRAGRQDARAPRPALRAAAGRDALSMVPAGRQLELRAGQADQARRRRHRRCRRRSSPAAFRCR